MVAPVQVDVLHEHINTREGFVVARPHIRAVDVMDASIAITGKVEGAGGLAILAPVEGRERRRAHIPQDMHAVKESDAARQSQSLKFGHGAGDFVGSLWRVHVLIIHRCDDPLDPLVKEDASCGSPDLARLNGTKEANVLLQTEEHHHDLQRYRNFGAAFFSPGAYLSLKGESSSWVRRLEAHHRP